MGPRRRTGSAFPPIWTLDAFRSCVEEPGRRTGRAVGRGCGAPSGCVRRRRDGGLAAVLRGRGAKRPLRRGGRKLPLRVGGLRGKGKRRDGADSRPERTASARPHPARGPQRPPAAPPWAARPAAQGLGATPQLLPLGEPSNPVQGLLSHSGLPHPRSCPVTPACPTLNPLLRDLLTSFSACRDLGAHRGPCAGLFCKYFLIATTRLEVE